MTITHQATRTDTSITVIVVSYGDSVWMDLARRRALPSAILAAGGSKNVLWSQTQPTLQMARNVEGMKADTDWIIFLDADDELDKNYVKAMQARIQLLPPGDFIIQPSTLGVVDGLEDPYEVLIPPKPSLFDGNHCVIGSAVPARLFQRVDGFDNWPFWEDWGLWLKCLKAGAQFVTCPEAIYRVHTDTARKSRNQVNSTEARQLFEQMRRHYQQWEVPA